MIFLLLCAVLGPLLSAVISFVKFNFPIFIWQIVAAPETLPLLVTF